MSGSGSNANANKRSSANKQIQNNNNNDHKNPIFSMQTPVESKVSSNDRDYRKGIFLTRKLPQTPAKKRSSLARPVRVHDAFFQPKIISNYYQQPNENAYKNFESNETTSWPARIRLENMIDYSLPHCQSKDNKRCFKDTDKLLKVISSNNVDQDLDSVKRCSLM